MALIKLRDQPGVEPLDWAIELNGGWSDDLEDQAHALAEQMFGVSAFDLDEVADEAFPITRLMWDEAQSYWASRGWDVSDGKERQLRVMDFLVLPLAAVVEKLHPDAAFAGAAESWGAQLEADAKRFRPSR